jgi:hypothetical protein
MYPQITRRDEYGGVSRTKRVFTGGPLDVLKDVIDHCGVRLNPYVM